MISKLTALLLALISISALGQQLSIADLLGEWTFTAYAERSAPDARTPVNAVFVFKPGGVLLTRMRDVETESTYSLEGDTFTYTDASGQQVWTIRDYEPGDSLVSG
jgi:hypothetical protein